MLSRLPLIILLLFMTAIGVFAQEATEEPIVFTGPKYEHIPDPNHPVLEMLRTIPQGDYPLVLYGDIELAQLSRGDAIYHQLPDVLPLVGQVTMPDDSLIYLGVGRKVTQIAGLTPSAIEAAAPVLFDDDAYLAATQAILAQESGNAIRQMLFIPATFIDSPDVDLGTPLAPYELLAVADTVLTNERTTITYLELVYSNEADAIQASETIGARWANPEIISEILGTDFATAWDIRGVLNVATRTHYDPATEKHIALVTLTHPLRRNNTSINLETGDRERGDDIPDSYEFMPSGIVFRTLYEVLTTGDTAWLAN